MAGKRKKNKNHSNKQSKLAAVERSPSPIKDPKEAVFFEQFLPVIDDHYARHNFPNGSAILRNDIPLAELHKRLREWKPNMTRKAWKHFIKKQKKTFSALHSQAIKVVCLAVDRLMIEDGAEAG